MDNLINLIIVGQFGLAERITANALPRMGDKIDMFYKPYPAVTNILLWPSTETLKNLGFDPEEDCTAIVTVS